MRTTILFLLWLFLNSLTIKTCAQEYLSYNRLEGGAIVETDLFTYSLDSINKTVDNTILYWTIKGKKKGTSYLNPNSLYIKDCKSGKKYNLTAIQPSPSIKVKRFEEKIIKMIFPPINDSISVLSVFSSPSFYVDSIKGNDLVTPLRYRVPLFDTNSIVTHNDSICYSDSLFNKGISLYNKRKYKEALSCFQKCYSFDCLLENHSMFSGITEKRRDYYSELWLACCYYKVGNIEKARKLNRHYMYEPYDRSLVKGVDSLYNLKSGMYSGDEMIELCKEICRRDSALFGARHYRYLSSLHDLSVEYGSCRMYNEAKYILNKLYHIEMELSELDYEKRTANILKTMAKIDYLQGNIMVAIQHMEEALGISKKDDYQIKDDVILISDYEELADYYMQIGNSEKAIRIQERRLSNYKELGDDVSYNYTLESLITYLMELGSYKHALRVCKNISTNFLSDLSLIGKINYYLGDYKKALENSHGDKALIARCYASLNRLEDAIQIQRQFICETDTSQLYYNMYLNGYDSYISHRSALSDYYYRNEQYDSALVNELANLQMKEQYYSPYSNEIAFSHLIIGASFLKKEMNDEANNHLMLSFQILKNKKLPLLQQNALRLLSTLSYQTHRWDSLINYMENYWSIARSNLLALFQDLTYDERSKYIERYSETLNDLMKYAYYMPSETMASLAYDALLLTKGALLSSEHSVKRIINGSNDASLKKLWEELRADRYILGKQLEKDSLERKLNTDSLQRVIYDLEDSLIMKCKEYEDITKNLQLKHQDIRHSLSSHDIAIEFLRVPIEHDSTMYVALALRKDTKTPKMIPLFEEKQLKQIPDTLYHQCEEMYDLVWKPLATELQGVENIYFSPSGALYNIGIEYLPGMEKYNVCRLSSTRELVTKKERTTGNRAVLYGGLDYNAPLDTLSKEGSLLALNEVFRGLSLRGSQNELPHTKDEVKEISSELCKAKWTCLLDTMSLGTEESFKALSGKKINILHIATHGFYYTPEEADNTMYDFLRLDERWATAEDKSLTRSGLIMSGANHVLERKELPDIVEDGILTAKEIADVDLRGLDLVVLSACQTGLGDITQGEGVFGLQRGFKKAGANTILMSLWKVDDKATQILMTQFYKNWLSGQSKRQALLSAQKYLRETQRGKYNDPKYWAAFILLDAIQE